MTRNKSIEIVHKYFDDVYYAADYLLDEEGSERCNDRQPDNAIKWIIKRKIEDPPSKTDGEILKALMGLFEWRFGWEFKSKKGTLPVDSLIPLHSGLVDISYFISTMLSPLDIIDEYGSWLYILLENCNSEKIEQLMWQYHYDIDYAIAKWFTDELITISVDLLRELNKKLLRSRVEIEWPNKLSNQGE